MIKRLSIFLLIAVMALSGCAGSRSATSEAPGISSVQSDGEASAGEWDEPANASPEQPAEPAQQDVERIVIRNAELTILVEDPSQAIGTVSGMAETMGGFIVSSNLYKTHTNNGQEVPEGSITIRVPADRLNEALSQIKGLVKDPENDVRSEVVSGQDVTKEYTDLNSRLKNLQETERQLREIMASAVKTEDVLAVHEQLTQIREQIEVIQGQIQYYQEAAALSSISVRILALASVQPLEIGGWQPAGVARDALQALIDTLQGLANIAIWLVIYVLPIGLVIFLPIGLLVRWLRKGAKARKVQAQAPPANPS